MFFHLFLFILGIIIIYLLAIGPKILARVSLKPFYDRYYAHRGLHRGKSVPENSMEAFRLAVENGYGIELDVHLTKDKIPVIFHDKNLQRVCKVNKNISDCTLEDLREYNLYDSTEKIPTLQEVLDLVDGQVPLIIELKSEDLDLEICRVVTSYLDDYSGLYCVESFNPLVVRWYKKNRPHIIRGQLSTKHLFATSSVKNKLLNFLLSNLLLNFLTKPDFIAYEHKYANNLSFTICRWLYKTPAVAYTIQSEDDLVKNKDRFDLFIFDSFIPKSRP